MERKMNSKEKISLEEFKEAFNLTKTNKETAASLGVSSKTVYNKLAKVGIKRGRYTVSLDASEVVRLYTQELKTAQEIGDVFNTSHTTIYKTLKQCNIPIRDDHAPLITLRMLEPFKEQILEDYTTNKYTFDSLAKKYKVSIRTVYNFFLDNNIPIRGKQETLKSVLHDQKDTVLEMLKDKKSIPHIAKSYDVTPAVVRKFLARWEINPKEFKK